ncbi:hypothetical protein [Pseudomonas paeninsulae]|uniref:hypothetical protein n=1 Tax=Pseudomonas paeninsulae TaxID=3110772 RepID=UPI002D794EA7|nr:hypothetical protein [Pseudomonas sp. IT1137]
MSPALALLFDGCQAVLQGDEAFIALLRDQDFVCGPGYWQFRLPALHGFVQAQLPAAQQADYPRFLQQLYASDLNSRLRELGAEVAIVDNYAKVDSSLYCLRRLAP